MFYSKFPIIFLSEMVSSKQDSTNGWISTYILEHLDEIKDDAFRDLASKTYVSTSSISRFCRDIGLNDHQKPRVRTQATGSSIRKDLATGSSKGRTKPPEATSERPSEAQKKG